MSVTGTFIRLGGAHPAAVGEAHERSGYALTGAAVTVSALVAGGVAAAASAPMWPVAVVVTVAAGVTAVAGVIARAQVSSPGTAPRRLWFIGRVLLALVLGLFLGEAATVVANEAAVDRVLDEKSHIAAESTPGVIDARAALERAVTERTTLERTITEAGADADRALVTARCEFNPTEQCPPTRITGVPGDGPEHRTARAMLDDARARLAAAHARVPGLDQRVTDAEQNLTIAYSAADRAGDRGLGARWAAVHEHSTASAATLLPRLAALLAGLLIALLPLLARSRLGVTSLDRRAAARAAMDEAERDAETAIVVQRARLRAATEELRAEQALDAVRLTTAVHTAARLPELGRTRRKLAPAVDLGHVPAIDRATTVAGGTGPVPAAVGAAANGTNRALGAASADAATGPPARGSAPAAGRIGLPSRRIGSPFRKPSGVTGASSGGAGGPAGPVPAAASVAPTGTSRTIGVTSTAIGAPITAGTGSAAGQSASTAGGHGSPFRGLGSSAEDTQVIDGSGDRRRTRVVAAIGGLEIGITEFARPAPAATEIRPGRRSAASGDDHATSTGPQSADGAAFADVHGFASADGTAPLPAGLSGAQRIAELPVIGKLPFTGWIGPLVPSFVLDAIDTATRPLQTARQTIEDIEELTFTLRHSRTITVVVRETTPGGEAWSGRAVRATVVDVEPVGSARADGEPIDLRSTDVEAVDIDARAHSPGTRFH